jgi:hypothetical protein
MADPMTNLFQGGSLGLMPQTRFDLDRGGYKFQNQGQGQYFVDPYRTGDTAAQDTLADLYEAEFQDYLNRFFPVEQDLIQQMTTGFEGLQQEEIGRAQQAVATQYANLSGQQRRRLGGFGLRETESFYKDLERSQVSATVAASNLARMRSDERRTQILSGGLGSALTDRVALQQGGANG